MLPLNGYRCGEVGLQGPCRLYNTSHYLQLPLGERELSGTTGVTEAGGAALPVEPQGSSEEKHPGAIAMATLEEEEGEGEYRCEMCDTVFASLTHFMDHRNYDCSAGRRVFHVWVIRTNSQVSNFQ